MFRATITTSLARVRGTATHRATGAAYAEVATAGLGRRRRRRTTGAATPAATTPHAATLRARERDTARRRISAAADYGRAARSSGCGREPSGTGAPSSTSTPWRET